MGFLDARYLKRRASWPVWSDSTTTPIRFQPMPKKAAVRLWHRARTSIARRASLVATAVLHALGLLNFATGRLDPSYAAKSLSRLARPGQIDGRRNRHCQEHRTSCNQEREHRSIPFSHQGHDGVDTNVAGERSELFHTIHPVVALNSMANRRSGPAGAAVPPR